ncbi:MAG: hypothetical protein NPIRA02_30070 [Nitrospirales bacterium]|nr:MAG: hypothetical protein NPIRA02_30070 [Nitrospirales bacterium]
MTGSFTLSDSASGIVDEPHVENLDIEGFGPLGSLGRCDLAEARQLGQETAFNFNFDTHTNTFLTGGTAGSSGGQLWVSGDYDHQNKTLTSHGFGFVSSTRQGLSLHGTLLTQSTNLIWSTHTTFHGNSTLMAQSATTIANPIPSSLPLFPTGLLGFIAYGLIKRRRAPAHIRRTP